MSKRLFGIVLLGSCLLTLVFARPFSVQAAQGINRQVSYQGKLLDATGTAVVDGVYQMKFRLYSAASGGTTLWSASGTVAVPTAIPITVQSGLFSLLLGDPSASGGWQNTLDGVNWNSDAIYLGVVIGSDSEMSPRKRLGAVPQAFNAEQLQGMYASSSASGGQTIFTINQTENTAATGTRTALEVRSNGTSSQNDYLLRGINDQATQVFALNRQGSVTSTGVFAFQGSGTSTLAGSLSVSGNVSSTILSAANLYAANAVLTALTATTLNASSLVWTNATGTNTTSTNLYTSLLGFGTANGVSVTTTNNYATFAQFVNALGTNATTTNSYASFSQYGNALGTNSTSTNSYASFIQFANALGANVTTTNSYATFAQFGNALGTNVTSTNSYATYAQYGNALGTNTTSTYLGVTGSGTSTFAGSISVAGSVSSTVLYAANAVLTALTATTLNASSLVWTNATGTNTTSTNLYTSLLGFGTANGVSVTTTNNYATFAQFVNALGTNATTTNSYASFSQYGNALGTNSTSTNSYASFIQFANALGANVTTTNARVFAGLYADVVSGSSMTSLGSVAAGTSPRDVVVDDRFVYVMNTSTSQVRFFHAASSTPPGLASVVTYNSVPTAMAVRNGTIYTVHVDGTFRVRPFAESEKSVSVGGTPTDIAISGRYAYITTRSPNRLVTVDIADSSVLLVASSLAHAFLDDPKALSVQDKFLYVVNESTDRFSVFSLSNPAVPGAVIDAPLSAGEGPKDVVAQGNYAYVLGVARARAILISDPSVPLASVDVEITSPRSLFVFGREMFVTTAAGVSVYDTSNPALIVLRGSLAIAAANPVALAVKGRLLYVIDAETNNLLRVYRLPGIEATGGYFSSAEIGQLQVLSNQRIGQNLDVGGSLQVGKGGFASIGPISVNALNTTSSITGNLTVGTSTVSVAMHPSFVMNGDDMFVGGNMGSASSVYTNGAFIAGTGSTYYNAASIVNTTGDYTVTSTGSLTLNANNDVTFGPSSGFVLGRANGATSLGSISNRFNGQFLNTTTTNATTTNLYTSSLEFQNASGTSATTTNLFARHIVTDDGLALIRTDSQISQVAAVAMASATGTSAVFTDDRYAVVLHKATDQFTVFDIASSTRPVSRGVYSAGDTGLTGGFLQGHLLFLTLSGPKGIRIYDLRDGLVTFRAALGFTGAPQSIAVQGGYAYVVTGGNALRIVDVANPDRPRQIAAIATSGSVPTRIAVSGRYAYITDSGTENTSVYEVTDPYHPHVLSGAVNSGSADVVTQGSYAFVGGALGVDVINGSIPSSPSVTRYFGVTTTQAMAIYGRYLFLATTSTGLQIVDVANLAAPQLVQSIGGIIPGGVSIRGRYAFVSDAANNRLLVYKLPGIEAAGIEVGAANIGMLQVLADGKIGHNLDVGDALEVGFGGIRSQGGFSVSATNTTSSIMGNLLVGTSSRDIATHAGFIMDGDDMFVGGNIGSASSVYTNGSFIAGTGSTYYNAASIVNTTGNFVVTSTGTFTMNANDGMTFRTGQAMSLLSGTNISFSPGSGFVLGSSDGATSLGSSSNRFDGYLRNTTTTILDVRDQLNQKISSASNWITRSTYSGFGGQGVLGVQVVGDYAYSVSDGALNIVDVRNPVNPIAVGSLVVGSNNQDVAVYGDYAYITATAIPAIYVVNIANPMSPFIEKTLTNVLGPTSIEIQGRYAYVAEGGVSGGGLKVFDLGHATGPRLVAHSLSVEAMADVAVIGRYAYMTAPAGSKVYVYDVSDPSGVLPLVGTYTATGFKPNTIVGQGNYMYVSDADSASVQVLSATTTPYKITSFSLGGIAALPDGLAIQGNYLYAVGTSVALEAVDVSVPTAPSLVKTFIFTGTSLGAVQVVGRYAYVAGEAAPKVTSIVDLGGIEAANANISSLRAGELAVSGDGRIGGNLFLNGNINVGQGIMAFGASAVAASTTGIGARFVNRADHTVNGGSWGAYADRLLVGDDVTATGTADYAMVVNYTWGATKRGGLCLSRVGGFCPSMSATGTAFSIIADDTIGADRFDLAEVYPEEGVTEDGDVLVFGSVSGTVAQSSGTRYDAHAMGVVSTHPGFLLGTGGGVKVALVGRVPTKFSPTNGAIAIGDPLTTSEYPGVAMKATKPGMILGYALEAAAATSTIEVFVKTGYSAGTILNTDGAVARLSDNLVVDSRGTATALSPTVDSWGLTFRGSAWNGAAVTQPAFSLITNVVTATSSAFVIRNASSSSVFAIDQLGTATIAGDLVVGGHIYPSGRGTAQHSKYIFLDDTSTSTQYMATNADGWQANDSYDFAERYYSPDALDTGDLVIASDRGQFHVQRSLNETGLLMGIVSTRPAFVAGKPGPDTYPIALAGRVPTKVSTMNGAIKVGDALAPSTIPGTAVKATKAGPIIGLALEKYDAAIVGKIEVFVNPGWWGGPGAIVQPVATQAAPAVSAPTMVHADDSTSYRGFASIVSGAKRVHVAYDSVLSFPNIQVTPRGQVHGGWWTDNYTDIGFDVFMNEVQTRDVTFTWSVEGTRTGAKIYLSDGTYALVNPTTGEAVTETVATSTADVVPTPIISTNSVQVPVVTTNHEMTTTTAVSISATGTEPVAVPPTDSSTGSVSGAVTTEPTVSASDASGSTPSRAE